jgi:hypothetical protein
MYQRIYLRAIPLDCADELHELGMDMPSIPIGAYYLEDDAEIKEMSARKWNRPCYGEAFEFLSQILNIFVTVCIDEKASVQQHIRQYYTRAVKMNSFGKKDAGTTVCGIVLYGEAMEKGLREAIKIAKNEV